MEYKIVPKKNRFELRCKGFAMWKCYNARGIYDSNPDEEGFCRDRVFDTIEQAESWVSENKSGHEKRIE